MNESEFREEVKDWLINSGKIQEFQSRLRSDLIQALARGGGKPSPNPIKESPSEQSLNSLVVEHLMNQGYWYSSSVFVSEAHFLVQPPDIEVVHKLGSESKRHTPSRIPKEDILRILRFLSIGEPRLKAIRSQYENNVPSESLLSVVLQSGASKRGEEQQQQQQASRGEKVLIDRLSRLLLKGESLLDTTTSTDEETQVDDTTRSQYLSKISEQSKTIWALNSELREAKRRLEVQGEAQSELARLRKVVDNQKYEIFRLKSQRRALEEEEGSSSVQRGELSNDVHDYLARIRMKTLSLTSEGQGIEEEFSRLSKTKFQS